MNVDLTAPWDLADIVFVIEDRKLYVNKPILMMSSDVFNTMFTADFREKEQTEIPLPGKKFDSFLLLMKVLHPPNMEVNATNVLQLLPLAHEYGIHHVTSLCEKVLLKLPPSVQNLVLADRYSLPKLLEASLTCTQHMALTQLEAQPGFDELQPETMIEVLRNKVLQIEPQPDCEDNVQDCSEVKSREQFIYELCEKEPCVEVMLEAEKYNLQPVVQACIHYLSVKPAYSLRNSPGYDDIKPATLAKIWSLKWSRYGN